MKGQMRTAETKGGALMSAAIAKVTSGYLKHVPRLMKRWDRTNVNAIARAVSGAFGALTIISALRQPVLSDGL
jgi:hypothetical protein